MNLEPIATLLQDAGIGTLGTNIFLNMLPPSVENGVLLKNPLGGTIINYEIRGYFKTYFQLIVRSHDYETGYTKAKEVSELLNLYNTQIDEQFFLFCRPRNLPVAFPLSKGNILEFNVYFDVIYAEAI